MDEERLSHFTLRKITKKKEIHMEKGTLDKTALHGREETKLHYTEKR
jgi:hypothetical protein